MEPGGALSAADLTRLAAPPASWYLLCRGGELPRGAPRALSVAGQELAAWRRPDGRTAAIAARCAHQHATLAGGRLDGELLRCPFHGWAWRADGRCVNAPGLPAPPAYAHLPAWPTEERHGLVHLFLGPTPRFPLPFFAGEDPAAWEAGAPLRLLADTPWYMVSANGFDEQHFAWVHGREHVSPPEVERPHPCARRVVHRFRVTGRTPADRLVRRAFGPGATLTFESWLGTTIVGTMAFGPFVNHLLVYVQPLGLTRCAVDFVVHVRRDWPRPLRALAHALLRRCTGAFFRHETQVLGGPRLDPERLTAGDALLRGYLEWLAAACAPAAAPQPTCAGR